MARSLIQSDALIHRKYFKECLDFYGIPTLYYQIKENKEYNAVGELGGKYYSPIKRKIIFDQVPKVNTLKKLGWVTELDKTMPLIHCEYDLPGVQIGCIFKIKDPITKDSGRLFRITKISMGIIYPANLTVQIVPIPGIEPEATTDPYDGPKTIFLDKKEGTD